MFSRYLRTLLAALAFSQPAARPAQADPMAAAYASAVIDVGEREEPWGSNSGPYVEGLRIEARLPRWGGGEWCAVFCSVHMLRAGLSIRSRSAKRLVHAVSNEGRRVRLMDLRPGMCGLSLHRRSGGWHVRIWRCVEADGELVIDYVGGNEKHAVRSGRYRAGVYVAQSKMLATI